MTKTKQLIELLQKDILNGLEGLFQLHLVNKTNQEIESHYLLIQKNKVEYSLGKAASKPDVILHMQDDDFIELITGRLNAPMAFMKGKLKVKGKLNLAMKAESLYRTKGGPELAKALIQYAKL